MQCSLSSLQLRSLSAQANASLACPSADTIKAIADAIDHFIWADGGNIDYNSLGMVPDPSGNTSVQPTLTNIVPESHLGRVLVAVLKDTSQGIRVLREACDLQPSVPVFSRMPTETQPPSKTVATGGGSSTTVPPPTTVPPSTTTTTSPPVTTTTAPPTTTTTSPPATTTTTSPPVTTTTTTTTTSPPVTTTTTPMCPPWKDGSVHPKNLDGACPKDPAEDPQNNGNNQQGHGGKDDTPDPTTSNPAGGQPVPTYTLPTTPVPTTVPRPTSDAPLPSNQGAPSNNPVPGPTSGPSFMAWRETDHGLKPAMTILRSDQGDLRRSPSRADRRERSTGGLWPRPRRL